MSLGKGKYLGSYLLEEDFRVAGGRSRISFATKDGKKWFVKEFLSPKYPTDDSPGSQKTKEYKRKMCEEFENHQRKIMKVTNSACSEGSNLICAKDLIRCGSSYYKVSIYVDTKTMKPEDVSKLSFKEIIIVLRSLASSLRILHNNHIVHGDLKPENILIKKTDSGIYTTKLIDFDDSYFEKEPPVDRQSVVGTPEYYSPEVFNYISDEDDVVPGTTLTTKSDIYTLGIIFCEYLTGQRPVYDKSKYIYTYAATNAGESVSIPNNKNVNKELKSLLLSMLDKDPDKRPDILQVFNILKKIDISESSSESPDPDVTVYTKKEYGRFSTVFPRLKLPKGLVLKLREDARGMVISFSEKPKEKVKYYMEKPIDKKSVLKTKSSRMSEKKSLVKPKLKGTLIK